jgi:hypothetical protein
MVLVTTKHRGVFVGTLAEDNSPAKLTLQAARCVIYWSAGTGGFLGLAEAGPKNGSRVGPAVPSLTLYDITAVAPLTDAAVKAFADQAPYRG